MLSVCSTDMSPLAGLGKLRQERNVCSTQCYNEAKKPRAGRGGMSVEGDMSSPANEMSVARIVTTKPKSPARGEMYNPGRGGMSVEGDMSSG